MYLLSQSFNLEGSAVKTERKLDDDHGYTGSVCDPLLKLNYMHATVPQNSHNGFKLTLI